MSFWYPSNQEKCHKLGTSTLMTYDNNVLGKKTILIVWWRFYDLKTKSTLDFVLNWGFQGSLTRIEQNMMWTIFKIPLMFLDHKYRGKSLS